MRSIKYTAGLLFIAVVSMGGQAILIKETHNHKADYKRFPGMDGEVQLTLDVKRTFRFLFPGATVDKKDKTKMALVADSTIFEYLSSDVVAARAAADAEAKKSELSADEIFQEKLKSLRKKPVDCRMVAKKMVDHLVGHRVEVTPNKNSADGESRYFQKREEFDAAVIAKNLEKITVTRGEPQSPACKETRVDGSRAKCGDLWITFNPRPAAAGPFKDRNAIVFNPDICVNYAENMDFNACELVRQIEGCGLRYVQKALARNSGKDSAKGLSDKLEDILVADTRALQNGEELLENDGGEAPSGPPTGFYDEFKAPSSGTNAR